ncbi:MAG: hypothetical protein IPO55_02755 [Alphaproteobacteria bacterium]|nr:hypothetical protein [Alphaproteobacteria bacterium]
MKNWKQLSIGVLAVATGASFALAKISENAARISDNTLKVAQDSKAIGDINQGSPRDEPQPSPATFDFKANLKKHVDVKETGSGISTVTVMDYFGHEDPNEAKAEKAEAACGNVHLVEVLVRYQQQGSAPQHLSFCIDKALKLEGALLTVTNPDAATDALAIHLAVR